jgi:hypothetical protein
MFYPLGAFITAGTETVVTTKNPTLSRASLDYPSVKGRGKPSQAAKAAFKSCIARPRWLMPFLISSGSSEKVWPYSGTMKSGS